MAVNAAIRFLNEASEGAWSDSPEPWENTARLGLSAEDGIRLQEILDEERHENGSPEWYAAAESDVMAYVRAKVAGDDLPFLIR